MKTIFSKDLQNNKMTVTREFSATPEMTWKAWTNRNILDQWWAPKPWKAETKSMTFKEGGFWLYSMCDPKGINKHWARTDYKKITTLKSYVGINNFCDENGNVNPDLPGSEWKVEFIKTDTGTKVQVEITYADEKVMKAMVEMGFEAGFTAAHSNLDELLSKN
jgi:uncharacterized protein YndB with AHSA1/START domain